MVRSSCTYLVYLGSGNSQKVVCIHHLLFHWYPWTKTRTCRCSLISSVMSGLTQSCVYHIWIIEYATPLPVLQVLLVSLILLESVHKRCQEQYWMWKCLVSLEKTCSMSTNHMWWVQEDHRVSHHTYHIRSNPSQFPYSTIGPYAGGGLRGFAWTPLLTSTRFCIHHFNF